MQRLATIFFIFLTATFLVSCGEGGATPELVDQNRFDEVEESGGSSAPPTNADLDLTQSTVDFSDTKPILGQQVVVTFIAKDSAGETIPEGGLTVSFEFLSDGTSTGTLGAVNDLGNGAYQATVDATAMGTPHTIRARVNGNPTSGINGTAIYYVGGGDNYKLVSLSIPTDQDDYQQRLVLNSSVIDYSRIDSNGDDLRFSDLAGNEYSYWIESWNTSGDSIVWVKITNSGTDEFRLFYNNSFVTAGSNVDNTFSYSSAKTIYHELSANLGGGLNMQIASYIDGNNVSTTGGGSQTVNFNSPQVFASTDQGGISVTGPISGRLQTTGTGVDTIVPISFASTTMGYPKSRGSDQWEFFNPGTTTANVSITNYNASGTIVNVNNSITVNPGQYVQVNYDVSKFGLVESDVPVLGRYYYSNSADGVSMLGGALDIVGSLSTTASIGILEDGTTGTYYTSAGASVAFSGDKGDVIDISGGGSQNTGTGVRAIADKPIIGVQQADSDGSESTMWWPTDEFNSRYIVPNNSQYVTMFCTQSVNLELYDTSNVLQNTASCTPSGNNPGRASFGAGSGNNNVPAGYSVRGDAPFYAYHEYLDQDETNILGHKQARSIMNPAPTSSYSIELPW